MISDITVAPNVLGYGTQTNGPYWIIKNSCGWISLKLVNYKYFQRIEKH
jgi:hypothetical protein